MALQQEHDVGYDVVQEQEKAGTLLTHNADIKTLRSNGKVSVTGRR